MGESWTPEEMVAADQAIAHLKRTITRISDLLTPEEHAELNADLAEMAAIRRRALEASAHIVLGRANNEEPGT
jgi:hypothetical protein